MTNSKRVLVTGATGQIGYMTYNRLREQPEKYDAYALDREREASPRIPKCGLSKNDLRWADIENAYRKVGYIPQDRAEDNHDYDSGLNSSVI